MTETQKDVVLLSFVERLKQAGSWCGETHIQKATYFLQELLGVPLGFNFILYKHGPYSFDLKDELTAQMADGLLVVTPRSPYGPSILPGNNSATFLDQFPKTRVQFREQAEFVASRFGAKGITDLERLATALFVTKRELPKGTAEERAARINQLKPHVPLDVAHDAVLAIDKLIAEAQPAVVSSP
jgi:hypothetical protein